MVSTRGIKLKFLEGERVLCYEPDPTKAKVLYDSKVLQIIVNKDPRGRKSVEYLIHFQGWNSSWDRSVGEEYVLKDTPENRQLQKDLAEKSQLHLGAYLYRKERKKRKQNERNTLSSEDGSSGSPCRMDTDDGPGTIVTSSSEDDSSVDDDCIQIDLTTDLREILENDYYLIKEKNRLPKLPAEPNVVTILETYYRQYFSNQICELNEKSNGRYRSFSNNSNKPRSEDVHKNLKICREVLDGLRVYFDYTLNSLLLYSPEIGQVETKQACYEPPAAEIKTEIKTEDDCGDFLNQSFNEDLNGNDTKPLPRRRTLRSNRSDSHSNGSSTDEPKNNAKPGPSSTETTATKAINWRLLPEYVYNEQPPPPCLVYGATHLTRLFVRLPELLTASNMSDNKLKVLLHHLDLFIEFLNEHKDWYGEKLYIANNF